MCVHCVPRRRMHRHRGRHHQGVTACSETRLIAGEARGLCERWRRVVRFFSRTRRRWRRVGGQRGAGSRGGAQGSEMATRAQGDNINVNGAVPRPRGSRHDWFWSSRSSLTRSRNRCNAHSHSMGSVPCWCDRTLRHGTSVLAELVACYAPWTGVTRRRPGGDAGNREQRTEVVAKMRGAWRILEGWLGYSCGQAKPANFSA